MRRPELQDLTAPDLSRLGAADLRAAGAEGLSRGERVQAAFGDQGVETLILGGRAAQASGGAAVWGDWRDGRLHVGSHQLDLDGVCVCPACETFAGLCGDDDE